MLTDERIAELFAAHIDTRAGHGLQGIAFARAVEAEARREALEEAAKVADTYEPRCDICPSGCANAIRALA